MPAFLKAIQSHFFSSGGLLSMDSVTSIAEEAQACVKDRPKSQLQRGLSTGLLATQVIQKDDVIESIGDEREIT